MGVRQTRAEIAAGLAMQKSSVSGRTAALIAKGCVFTVEKPGGESLYFDPDESAWPARAKQVARAAEIKAFTAAVQTLKPYLPGPVVEDLRGVYRKILAD